MKILNQTKSPSITISNLSVPKILENINCNFPSGEHSAIIGPSGAGKTTLLSCIALNHKYSGKISINNNAIIGFVPQMLENYISMPLLVYEFFALWHKKPLWLNKKSEMIKLCLPYLSILDSSNLIEKKLNTLSGGELRIVLLAHALSQRPNLLILDEPESGMDTKMNQNFWKILDSLRQEQKFTLITVSHNLPLVAHYANHVICINKTIIKEGDTKSCLQSNTLLQLFGIPIHLYPSDCDRPNHCNACATCGAFVKQGESHV